MTYQERNLTGKVALITGAARRIGAVTARLLHHAGMDVVIHYRHSAQDAQALQAELNAIRPASCHLVQGDLLEIDNMPVMMTEVLAKAGRLDVLVNNASGFYPTALGEITEAHWDDLMGSNLKAPLFLAQAAREALNETHGCIVNMVDVHGFRPLKGYPVYCAAKAGLLMLTQSLAREFGVNVRVNGVAPGAILWPETEVDHAARDKLLAKTALKREGSPEDIARAVLFLVRDADYITGQVIPVDGGRTLNQ